MWVLETACGFGKAEILAVLDPIVRTRQFEAADKDTMWHALGEYRRGKTDFSDCHLGRADERDGASQTLAFDKALKGSPRFRVLSA